MGIEISSVVSMNSGRMSGSMPLWKRWCCQTKNDSKATPSMPAAAVLVGEERFAGEHRQDLHDDAETGQRHDVHLGVAEEPEQVLPQEATAPVLVDEERRLRRPIQHAEEAGHHQGRGGQGEQGAGGQDGPDEDGYAAPGHPRGPVIDDGGGQVEPGQIIPIPMTAKPTRYESIPPEAWVWRGA